MLTNNEDQELRHLGNLKLVKWMLVLKGGKACNGFLLHNILAVATNHCLLCSQHVFGLPVSGLQ